MGGGKGEIGVGVVEGGCVAARPEVRTKESDVVPAISRSATVSVSGSGVEKMSDPA